MLLSKSVSEYRSIGVSEAQQGVTPLHRYTDTPLRPDPITPYVHGALLALLFSLFLIQAAQAAWVPPIGIPAPAFGIDETVEGLHGDPAFRTRTITGGGDLTSQLLTLAAGDVVVIESSNYVIRGGTTWTHVGTASQPIIVRGASALAKPVLSFSQGSGPLTLRSAIIFWRQSAEPIFASIKRSKVSRATPATSIKTGPVMW